jgi:hypothetical protein
MRPLALCAILPALLLAPPATANDFCDKLKTIVAAAPGNFATIRASSNVPGHAAMVLDIGPDNPATYTDPDFVDTTISLADRFDKPGAFYGCYLSRGDDKKFGYFCRGVTGEDGGYRFWHPEEAAACLGEPLYLNGAVSTGPVRRLGWQTEYTVTTPHAQLTYASDPRGHFPSLSITRR